MTYVAARLCDIVREFHFSKANVGLGHPVFSRRWRVWMRHPLFLNFGIGFSRHHPSRVVKLVSMVVSRQYFHEETVLRRFRKAGEANLRRRKHSPKQGILKSCLKSTTSLKIEPFWQKRRKGAIYENIFGGNCGGTIGANAAQKRNRGMIRRRKTSNLLNKSISDTLLAYICANLAKSLVFFSENNFKEGFRNRISENDKMRLLSIFNFLNF